MFYHNLCFNSSSNSSVGRFAKRVPQERPRGDHSPLAQTPPHACRERIPFVNIFIGYRIECPTAVLFYLSRYVLQYVYLGVRSYPV